MIENNTLKKIIGWLLLSTPFIGIFIITTIESGIYVSLSIFGCVICIVLIVILGLNLIMNS